MIRFVTLLIICQPFILVQLEELHIPLVLSRRFPTKQLRTCFVSSELVDWCEHNEIDAVCWLFLPSTLHGKPLFANCWWEKLMGETDEFAGYIICFQGNYLFVRKISHEHNLSLFAQKTFSCLKKTCHQKFSFFCWEGVQGLFWRTPF